MAETAPVLEVKGQLDTLVVSIELTLVSIVQGTALAALIAVAQPALLAGDVSTWPCLVTGLLFILIFWSSAVSHTLSFISWPLELGHNFLYITVTLVEVVTISQAATPASWFAWCALYSAAGWFLYAADLRLLRAARPDFRGPNADRLYDDLLSEQLRAVRYLMPGAVVFHLGAWFAVTTFPLALRWHAAIAAYQCAVFAWFLWDVARQLKRRQGWIFQRLVDQRSGNHLVVTRDDAGLDVLG